MPKLTPEERAALEAQLADDDQADDDDEYEVGFGDGSYIRGRHSRVSKAAAARGFKLEPDPVPDEGEGKDGGKVVKGRGFGEGRRVAGRRIS